MKSRVKTIPMNRDWFSHCEKNGWTLNSPYINDFIEFSKRTPVDGYENPYLALRDLLLGIAGESVCFFVEEDIEKILKRGRIFRGYKTIMRRGEECRCHSNSAHLWEENKDKLQIVTGYGLSKDGMWRCHTWCVTDKDVVIETTIKRILYFGFVLTKEESEKFSDNNWL